MNNRLSVIYWVNVIRNSVEWYKWGNIGEWYIDIKIVGNVVCL